MEFKLPELGEGVNEGELVKWLVKTGDSVKDDQPLCEIMTDKATIEIPSPFSGKIASLNAKEGEVVKVHQVILTAETASSSVSSSASSSVSSSKVAASPAHASVGSTSAPVPAASAPVAQAASTHSADVLASPYTRRTAREQGIDLTQVAGSGPHGRILLEDLDRPSAGGAPAVSYSGPVGGGGALIEERIGFRGLRKKIAEKMRESKHNAAHFTYVEEADVTELVKLRAKAKAMAEKQGVKLTYLPFVMKAMVSALRKFPIMNSTLDEAKQEIVIKKYYNIALSVQTDDGLTVPVVKSVESKSVFQIAREIQDLVDRARRKKLTSADLTGSTITLTNAGSIGGLFATPVINYPEVAILGFNKISRKPVVKVINGNEKIAIRDWTYFSISLDHRIVDGAIAAEFMKAFIEVIENPTLMFLE